mgnify:CR=1 FL=1
MTTIIDDPSAPTEYEYEIGVEGGYVLTKDTEGGIVVLSQDQSEVLSLIDTPWAKDAEGKEVKTHFEIRGNKLIQVVEHNVEGVVYPVAADPHVVNRGWGGKIYYFNRQETNEIGYIGTAFGGAIGIFVPGGRIVVGRVDKYEIFYNNLYRFHYLLYS